MRRGHKAMVLLGVFILAVIVGVGAYLFISDKLGLGNKTGEGTKPASKSEVKFLNSKKDGSLITQSYKANINGKEIVLDIKYTYEIEETPNTEYSRIERVTGKLGDIVLFSHVERTNNTTQRAQLFETNKIDKEYNIAYFNIVRGTDEKDYLAIATHLYDDLNSLVSNYLYILNDNLEVISNVFDDITSCSGKKVSMMIHPGANGLLVSENIWYPNQFKYTNRGKNFTSVKVAKDKIYYLYHDIDVSVGGVFGKVEEREYTINDNKLEFNTTHSYNAVSLYGQAC